ncbi:MAG: S-adenosyl-methyltransferase MraW [Candidatus Saccharibacteria bacterium]|nr:S-adenosyl-methyltransferase MraW [Candidatus Saccharibacteria bacterium]
MNDKAPIHTPVMVQEVLTYLSPSKGDKYLDLTAGYGGHASAVADVAGKLEQMTLVDRDSSAVAALTERFGAVEILHDDFAAASEKLASAGRSYDMILADLGASSLHLDEAGRGFSFTRSGPLDMRMDPRQELTAAHLLNHSDEQELGRILRQYGEEQRARVIAKAIIAARPLTSTDQLAQIIENTVPKRFGRKRIHPATKTFQALRIAVNDELNQLSRSLPLWGGLLAPGGRLVVISFHSLEDRIVKQYFKENAGDRYDAELTLLTKKPITAGPDEIVSNPRARSAKLRAAAKIKTKTKG